MEKKKWLLVYSLLCVIFDGKNEIGFQISSVCWYKWSVEVEITICMAIDWLNWAAALLILQEIFFLNFSVPPICLIVS